MSTRIICRDCMAQGKDGVLIDDGKTEVTSLLQIIAQHRLTTDHTNIGIERDGKDDE